MRKIPHLERLFPRIAKVAGFTTGAITERSPAGQTSFPPAMPVSLKFPKLAAVYRSRLDLSSYFLALI